MGSVAQSFIFELEAAVGNASDPWRSELLRRVTDLFFASLGTLSDRQIDIFDDIIGRLIKNAEVPALIELSARLAPLDIAPVNVVGRLAGHDNTAVSDPMLDQSVVLTDQVLVDIATTKRQTHLLAIAGRKHIGDIVTDSLIERGNPEVLQKVIANHSARISELGFVKLIGLAKSDKALAAAIATRTDLPPELEPFLKLTLG
jgi:uncharacterized protein (DUF2336 family)